DTAVSFRYVDLSGYLGPGTDAISAAHFLGTRLYLGFAGSGGSEPHFLALAVPPATDPGIDATGTVVVDLGGDAFPGFASSPAVIESFGDLGGLLYVASRGGV